MATHSSILARKIPWPEKHGWPQPTVLQRFGYDLLTKTMDFYSYLFSYPVCKCAKWLQSLMSPDWQAGNTTVTTFLSLSQGSPTSNSKKQTSKQTKNIKKHTVTGQGRDCCPWTKNSAFSFALGLSHSVNAKVDLIVSDSLQLYELLFTRLLCPWDSLGWNIGMGCHALLQGIFPTQGSNLSLLHW